jgi:uroporphyrinogen decarboxylase
VNLTHKERIERTISGQNVDRPAVSLWRHFPVDDQNPENLSRAILQFQERFDFDFIKITSSSTYCIKDYGVEDEWEGNPEGTRKINYYPIKSYKDWEKLKPLSPQKGILSEQIKNIQLIKKNSPNTTPILQTIFSPLSQIKNLVGRDNLLFHLRMYPEEVKKGLQTITENTIKFVNECLSSKIDGIFYAVQYAQFDLLNESEFLDFGQFYDLQILEASKPFWFNLGHLHGKNIMFNLVKQYPVQVLNWHDLETYPSLEEGQKIYSYGAVCGGLRQWETLAYGTPEKVQLEAKSAIERTNGRRFILGTGCVTPIIAPDSNIFAARQAVENYKGKN